jgi:hypothetical protein
MVDGTSHMRAVVVPTLKGLTAAVDLTPIDRKDEAMQWAQPRTAQLRATGTEIRRLGPGAGPGRPIGSWRPA